MGQAKQRQKVSESVAASLNQSRAAADMEMQREQVRVTGIYSLNWKPDRAPMDVPARGCEP